MGNSKSKVEDKSDIHKPTTIDKLNEYKVQFDILKNSIEKIHSEDGDISHDKIDKFVEEMMLNKNINIGYLPDYVEKQIYKNIFSYMMNMFKEIILNSKIQVVGHEITISIKPINEINEKIEHKTL